MIVLKTIEKINIPTVVALGNFDSMHLGHQKLIKKAVDIAKEKGYISVVFTFSELPINVISGKTIVKNVHTQEEKFAEIEALGADVLVNATFDAEMQGMSPKDFAAEILKKKLNCDTAVCGYNYSFGYMGYGNPNILTSLGRSFGFYTEIMEEFKVGDTSVSSTMIRELLTSGKVAEYERFTGRRYAISGKVIEGNHLGTRMGYPTVNLNLSESMALPVNGVYVTIITVNGESFLSVTNIGNKPTVGKYGKNAETHIFGFSGDLYGAEIKVEFIDFLRPEYMFESIEALENQIAKDCEEAKAYFRKKAGEH